MDARLEQLIRTLKSHRSHKLARELDIDIEKPINIILSELTEDDLRRINDRVVRVKGQLDINRYEPLKLNVDNIILLGPVKNQKSIDKQKAKVISPPGFSLLSFSRFLFSKKIFEEIFQPVISDMQVEYYEALKTGDLLKARWVVFRGRLSFWNAVISFLPVSVIRRCSEIWKAIGTGA